MSTEQNQETSSESTNAAPEVKDANISLSREEYDNLMKDRASLGSLKREFKDLKKAVEEKPVEASKPSETGLLQKSFLRAAGITHPEDVELAINTAKKWGVEVDVLVDDEDFKAKLVKAQTQRSNELASSNIKGTGAANQAKSSPEYWIAKGAPPSAADVPNRKERAKIARAFLASAKSSRTFYND